MPTQPAFQEESTKRAPSNQAATNLQRHPSLQRYISRSGYCSRRKAAALIAQEKVELDGAVCTAPWQPVAPGQRVQISEAGSEVNIGREGQRAKRKLYLALHKPPGYITTNKDPQGPPVRHRPNCAYIFRTFFSMYVGRLDKNSSGLLFFTNDGDFAQAVQHPLAMLKKEYEARALTHTPLFILEHWQRGIDIAGVRYRLRSYELLGQRKARLVLTEGLNREIRRVFDHFHVPLKQMHRVRIGSLWLADLAPGQFRPLKPYEIKTLQVRKNMPTAPNTEESAMAESPIRWPHPKQSGAQAHNS